VHFLMSDFLNARAEGAHALELARGLGDRVEEAATLAGIGFASVWTHEFERALDESASAMAVARDVGADAAFAAALFNTGFVHAHQGRLEEAKVELRDVATISRSVGNRVHEALAVGLNAGFKNWEGDFEAATAGGGAMLALARESNVLVPVLVGIFFKSLSLVGKGDYEDARVTIEDGLALTEKVNDEVMHQRLLNISGWLHAELGDFERATHLNGRCADDARKRGDPETVANAELNIADILMAKGDLVVAGELLEGVRRVVEDRSVSEWMKWRYSMHLFAGLGQLFLTRGELDKAREFVNRCVDQATRTASRKYIVRGRRLRGELAMVQRRWDDAGAALREALDGAVVLGNPSELWKTHEAFGHLREAEGKREDARAAYSAAAEVVDQMRGRLSTPALRAALDCAAFAQRLAGLAGTP
jgi:tetratricopeptide (TPR) repeat protein